MRVSTQEIGIPRPEHRQRRTRSASVRAFAPCSLRPHRVCRHPVCTPADSKPTLGVTTTTPPVAILRFLMDRYGWMPYRDFFETSMPGTFLFTQSSLRYLGPATSPSFSSTTLCWVFFVDLLSLDAAVVATRRGSVRLLVMELLPGVGARRAYAAGLARGTAHRNRFFDPVE